VVFDWNFGWSDLGIHHTNPMITSYLILGGRWDSLESESFAVFLGSAVLAATEIAAVIFAFTYAITR
jgi:hypothetical protein